MDGQRGRQTNTTVAQTLFRGSNSKHQLGILSVYFCPAVNCKIEFFYISAESLQFRKDIDRFLKNDFFSVI